MTQEYYEASATAPGQWVEGQWWRPSAETNPANPALVGSLDSILQRQTTRYDNFRRLISIFEWGFRAGTLNGAHTGDCPIDEDHLSHNAAQNIIETVQSKVTKNEIVPMPITVGGTFTQRKRARQLGHALAGEFQENDVAALHEDVVTDALVCGTSFAKVYRKEGRVKIDHVLTEHLVVDETEGLYRAPRTIGVKMPMDRFVVLAAFADPDDKSPELVGSVEERRYAIHNAKAADIRGQEGYTSHNGQIDVYEGWHLPSRKPVKNEDGEYGETDGRHQIAVNGRLLVDEPYYRMTFPIAKYCPRKRRRSYWGLSMMHNLASGQREYEKVTLKVQRAHQKMGGTHIMAPAGSVTPEEWDNDQGTLVEYKPNAAGVPTVFNPDPVNPATYGYMDSIPTRMSNTAGISQMSTSSQLPAGLQQASGKALQVFDDFEAERLLPYHKESERFHIELAQLVIQEVRDIVADGDAYETRARTSHQKWMDKLDWNKVLLDEDEYRLEVEASNNLASKPAARYEQLSEMLQDNAITIEQFRRLWGLPDLEAENELDTADTDIIDENLEKMAIEGVYNSPQPFDNLQLYVQRAGKFYNLCRLRGCSEKNLGLIQEAIHEAQRLLSPPPAPAPVPIPGQPPPVVGAPPPMAAPGQPPPMGPPPGAPMPAAA